MHACLLVLSHKLAVPAGRKGSYNIYQLFAKHKDEDGEPRYPLIDFLQEELAALGWDFSSEMVERTDPRPYEDDEGQVHSGGRPFHSTIFERMAEACYKAEMEVRCLGDLLVLVWVSCTES